VARTLIVTPVLQAVLRELLDEGRAVRRCHYDIVVATGLASGTVHPVLMRLAEAGWVTSQVVPAPHPRRHRPRRDYLLTREGLSLAAQAIAARPAARRKDGEVALRALRALERAAAPVTTRQVMVAVGDGDSPVLSYYKSLTAHFTAGRVTRHGTRGPYTWLITDAGRDWLAREGDPAPARAEKRGPRYRSRARQAQRTERFRETAGRLHRPWTDAERATAARNDLTLAELALLLGRTPQSVASARTYPRRQRQNEAARETASRHRQPWTDADLETASRDDLTVEQMAVMTGRTHSAVRAVRARLNSSGDSRARGLRDGTPPGPVPAAGVQEAGGGEQRRGPRYRALPMLRALAGSPQGLTAHDLAVTCAWDVPVRRDALQLAMRTMRQQEKAGRVRRAGTAVPQDRGRRPAIRWEVTEAGRLAASGLGPADPAADVLAVFTAEQGKLEVMMAGAIAGGAMLGDRMTGLAAEAARQLGRKSAASGCLARAREGGTAEAAAADYGRVIAEAGAALGECAARGRELVTAGTAALSAVAGQAVRTRAAVLPLIWQLPEGRKAVYALEMRRLALLRRHLAALVKIGEGLRELEQAEREMAALDRSLEQASLRHRAARSLA